MSPVFTMIMVILAVLAVLDLIVGVSNDAINFLNSSLGSKVASVKVILIVAAFGIIVGVLTSSGMMEVARNGVFHPEMFTFKDVMFLFVGVMLSDVILLNTFNALGLPTSTTVSLIFELLGSAVAVALFKISVDAGLSISHLDQFINTGKALGMITGILCSVACAFIAGSVLMYVSRLIFTFKYAAGIKKYGAVWCGFAITGIIYFAVFKGLKSSGIITPEFSAYVSDNLGMILLVVWVVSSILLFLLQRLHVCVLKVTILSGTFALALAFAGNDLVNFIGVPLAGFDSYNMALNSGNEQMLMGGLVNATPATLWLLLLAGVIMAVTLFFSRDAMKVSATELKLSSQNAEDERFGSSPISRSLVRFAINLNRNIRNSLPTGLVDAVNRRFIPVDEAELGGANYDKIRAVVNLTAASILICLGTSLKLPLSTTYVVFMVAMGSSLADRAWGRDSAVYRISGVLIVISGWFMTAVIGFTLSMLIGLFLMWGEGFALVVLVVVCGYLLCRRFITSAKDKEQETLPVFSNSENANDVLYVYSDAICKTMDDISGIYNRMLIALYTENRTALKEELVRSQQLYRKSNEAKYGIVPVLSRLEAGNVATAHFYVQVVDYLCEVTKALLHCTRPAYEHINNNHRGLTGEQIRDLKVVNDEVDNLFATINRILVNRDFEKLDSVMHMRDNLFETIAECIKNQIKRLKEADSSTKASALYFNILNETKTMVLQARNVIKAQAYFLDEIKDTDKTVHALNR
ncbi:MAG: inorganic phosphate transporter [Muribaculaceae bacterium]